MPNWCQNGLTLQHDNPEMITRAISAFARGALCNEFAPIPEDKKDNSWDWCIENWGTKWDVGGENEIFKIIYPTMVEMSFDSAWTPPMEVYNTMSDLGFKITGYYYESGNGFCGCYTSEGGDEYFEIEGNADWVEANIPNHIDEYFEISVNMDISEQGC